MPPLVRAAGGVVWRLTGTVVEVLVVHRPRYDDWSIPKGKQEPGESDEDTARREVEEETGLRCRVGEELGSTEYVDHRGRPKRVRFWLMEPVEGAFSPNDEVDHCRWIAVDEIALVTQDGERQMLRRAFSLLSPSA